MANKKLGGKNRKAISIAQLCVILVLIVLAGFVALNGFGKGTMVQYMKPWGEAISLGLDLRGGVYTVYQAQSDGVEDFDGKMDTTVNILTGRLTRQGFTEATVTRQGNDRIRIEIPDVKDPNEILTIIGTPAHLVFKDNAGNVVMEGQEVKEAYISQDDTGTPCVAFRLSDVGTKQFAEATAANLNRTISIELDGEVISAPTVNSVIAGGSGIIQSPGMTVEEASNLAMLIQSGALPLDISQLEVSAISATLGVEALDKAILAAVIGVILVMLFMIARYRLCGVIADIALTVYILLVIFLLAVTGAQLTLPGVAGIILGIGMAVDANVIIFERIREELNAGRPLFSSVKKGFSNALSAIMDSNVTTIIAALVLLWFGTGSIKGFAITLSISVITSMFTAVVVTHGLLNIFVNLGIENKALYARPAKENEGHVLKDRSKICIRVSAIVIAVALVMSVFGFGMNLGIDFTGGIIMEYDMGEDYQVTDIQTALANQGISDAQIQVTGEDGQKAQIRIRDVENPDEMRAALEAELSAKYTGMQFITVDRVGAVAGRDLILNALKSVLVAAALMLLYIAIRFDFYSGLAAVIGLVHDVLIMVALMVFLRPFVQVNTTFIAAMLTIVGYSINNTIVIFDRIRENVHGSMRGKPRAEIVTASIRECFTRTVSTTLTTLLTTVTLFVLGVASIREFTLPLIVGIVSGVYSANAINGYVWAFLMDHRAKAKQEAKKA
ncbi:protein translocase subunit SecD [Beduinella massiliensis]|uniref:protein translocase subunit SecD n=1 Tax=Beduinella massiliensis TaxID=1852363 RepID=UPI0031F940BD